MKQISLRYDPLSDTLIVGGRPFPKLQQRYGSDSEIGDELTAVIHPFWVHLSQSIERGVPFQVYIDIDEDSEDPITVSVANRE